MVITKFGRKHVCQNCGAKFFDLLKVPPECPKCGTIVEQKNMPKTRGALSRDAKDLNAKKPSKDADKATLSVNQADFVPSVGHSDEDTRQDLDDVTVEGFNEAAVEDIDDAMADDLDDTVMEDTSDLHTESSGVSGVEEQLDIPSQSKDEFGN